MTNEGFALVLGILMFFSLNTIGHSLVGPVVCEDGWHSSSIGRQGACSHHGGVDDELQHIISISSFFSGIFGGFYSYGVMNKISEKKRREDKIEAKKLYEKIHKNDPHCSRHPEERLLEKNGKYGKFWGCPRHPRCKHTKKF